MDKVIRTAARDPDLHIEAYSFQGPIRPFPDHFHEQYMVGYVEAGERELLCSSKRHAVARGDLLLLHPGEVHACVHRGEGMLRYRSLAFPQDVIARLAAETIRLDTPPQFSANVIRDSDVQDCFRTLHDQILSSEPGSRKQKTLREFGFLLLERYGCAGNGSTPPRRDEIEMACRYLEEHYGEPITLDQLCACVRLGKSTLLRAFARAKGVSPHGYLENIRIQKAKKLLESGAAPAEVALRTGFFDQSHFTNCFTRYIGVPPGLYRSISRA